MLLCGLVLAGCGSDDTGGTVAEPPGNSDLVTKKVDLKAAGFAFDPTAIQLTAGEAAQFVITNGDSVEHNLTVEGIDVDQDVEAGKTAQAPATKALEAGTYKFHCEYHPDQMQGTVTVT
ncbi:MAG TPA: cupredoxin domain-containing protein [Acidimicrobiales bacterium]|nr:cupredoxin domain-containing protein [Acidimicrobiales bacterium]